jgi:cell division protease FtsH
MATVQEPLTLLQRGGEAAQELSDQWRRLARAATFVAVLTSPALLLVLREEQGWPWHWAIIATVVGVAAFRGGVDLLFRRSIPWPSLFGIDSREAREEDVVNRRRVWFWRFWFRLAVLGLMVITAIWVMRLLREGAWVSWIDVAGDIAGGFADALPQIVAFLPLGAYFLMFFVFNFLILMGPLLAMGLTQIRGFEPGDAEWGVKLADVRGQAEAKEEVRRVVSLWQSGEAFEKAGGKRERGLLFLGAPGTGKTMLAKAIATGFNCPFVSIPGSGFASTFIGIDAVLVRILARKAKKLARKWGGQCIVFIDEIDAVGMRRQALGGGVPGGAGGFRPPSPHDYLFFGPYGALTPSGDLILETQGWRERLFVEREPGGTGFQLPGVYQRISNFMFPGMGGGMGSLALNQLLVVMDGIDNPPFGKRVMTNRINTFLDAMYVVPRRLGPVPLRIRPPRPRKEQIYFIGATNVPIDRLDPALIRPGRMGRHVWFRTPTKQDRLDVFDLYINKVSHDPELDTPRRRDELARITNGYSPAMIDQVCSMALTIAHHTGRESFGWDDIVEAMTTIESGTAVGVEYVPEETRAVAIHEAGHAVAAHAYMKGSESTRLSIRMRSGTLGHHQALQKEERFGQWRHEEMARLIWSLGAMAAERVFYGENGNGVGGDVFSATAQAALMVGASAMGPERIELNRTFADETEEETRARVMKRFEAIGKQIMNRTGGGGPFAQDPIAGVLGDPDKRAAAAQILGQAYVSAHNLIAHNKDAVDRIADELVARRELYGDELVELLEGSQLEIPPIDLVEEDSWPKI